MQMSQAPDTGIATLLSLDLLMNGLCRLYRSIHRMSPVSRKCDAAIDEIARR